MKNYALLFLFLVSSFFVQAQTTENKNADLEKAISTYRKGKILLQGKPGAEVQVQQTKHEFWFGCALSSPFFSENTQIPKETIEMYKTKFLENFNSAVTENAVKWASMERNRGEIDYQTPENIAAWSQENGIPCRGHNLYWGIEKFVQPWVKNLSDEELEKALKLRGVETAKLFQGKFVEYDLNNEMIHRNYYQERLGEGITKKMADWVLQGDPEAKLWLNDYDILTGNRLNDYMEHIKSLQKQNVSISGIGVQGHLHGDSFSREELKHALEKLQQFNLPIRITEFNIPGQRSKYYNHRELQMTAEEELQKAKDLVDYYTICFASPNVEGILMWCFWEGANWIPQSSLYKRDWTPTPALEAYQNLIFEKWWTRETITLDNKGNAELDAFFGDYELVSGGVSKKITHSKNHKKTTVSL